LKEFSKSKINFEILQQFFIVSIRMKGIGEADEARVTSLKEQLNSKLDVYDEILAKQPYLAGQVNQQKKFIVYYLLFN